VWLNRIALALLVAMPLQMNVACAMVTIPLAQIVQAYQTETQSTTTAEFAVEIIHLAQTVRAYQTEAPSTMTVEFVVEIIHLAQIVQEPPTEAKLLMNVVFAVVTALHVVQLAKASWLPRNALSASARGKRGSLLL